MKRIKVAVLGGTGMLGSMLVDVLSRETDIQVSVFLRSCYDLYGKNSRVQDIHHDILDVYSIGESDLEFINEYDWIVNAIGITKPLINDNNPDEIERAVRVNSLFPHILSNVAVHKTPIIQIATDCVYSGTRRHYKETDQHDPVDVYGKTKSLGEVKREGFHNIRSSIIGPEPKSPKFLLEWFLHNEENAQLNGFVNHEWNGVTTLHFAKMVKGIVLNGLDLPNLHHFVPADQVSKSKLLRCFAEAYNRKDIVIRDTEAPIVIDRTLSTIDANLNAKLWKSAGYDKPPTVFEMVQELAVFDYRF